jgi:hypothetical protein
VLSSEKPDPLGTLLEASNQKQKVALNNRTWVQMDWLICISRNT